MGEYLLQLCGRLDPVVVRSRSSDEVVIGIDDEYVRIAESGDDMYAVSFVGADARAMRETVERLRLPKGWPSSLGERVFHWFRQSLNAHNRAGHCELFVEIARRDEQLTDVFERLSKIYVERLGR